MIETSPAHGDTGVAVNRETIFRFSGPLAPDTVLTPAIVTAQAGGRTPLLRVELAPDRRSATLFYLEPLPPSTWVTARLDGFAILDAAGYALDADADGRPGGVGQISFSTVNATSVGRTAVQGRVLDSVKNPDGSERPLPGVTITVDGAEQTLRAVTDVGGFFVLASAPAGRFFVHVDGRTSPLGQWPDGAYYPFIGKAWDAVPGQTNNLANGTGLIFLPRVPADALQPVSATETTVVQFAPSILATDPSLAGVEVRIPPNALYSNDGSRGGRVGLAPVPPDRLPEPLPTGLMLPLVITIQTDGPGNFDRPVPVRFPNLPDPVTGVRLPPGSKSALWSFDHDTGRWEVAGPMTISADGLFAETDPGVGVRQPGWHGSGPGGPGGGPRGRPDDRDDQNDCQDSNSNGLCDDKEKDPCELVKLQMIFSFTDTFAGIVGLLPDVKGAAANCALAATTSALQGIRDCGIDPENCFRTDQMSTVTSKAIDFGIGCAANFTGELKPVVDAAVTLKSLLDTSLAYQTYLDCRNNNARSSVKRLGLEDAFRGNPFRLQYEMETRLGVFMDILYGPGWSSIRMGEMSLLGELLDGLRESTAEGSPGGFAITAAERAALLALPRPEGRSAEDVETLLRRFEQILPGGDPSGFDLVGLEAAAAQLQAVLEVIVADGWTHTHEGYARGLVILQSLIANAGQGVVGAAAGHPVQPLAVDEPVIPGLPNRPHAWWLLDLNTGFARRGMLNAAGDFEGLILAPDSDYLVAYADPLTGRAGVNQFHSAPSGQRTILPGAVMAGPPAVPDRDADGLTDFAELVAGTDPDQPDTDGDGETDGAEFLGGGNPLDGQEPILGVVGGADTPGQARDVAVDGALAVVLDGTAGVAVFNLTDPRSPMRIAQVDLARPESVALSGGLALVGQSAGVALLDLRTPATPQTVTNFAGTVVPAVALASPYGYFGRGTNVFIVDLAYGTLLPPVGLPSSVDALAVDGDLLHVLTRTALHVFRRSGAGLSELSSLPVAGSGAPRELGRKLFAGGGRAYVGYFQGFTIIDVREPAAPKVLAVQPATQAAIHDFSDNGSGLLAAITSFAGTSSLAFSLYDIRSGTATTNFLTSLDTPGDPYAVTLHRGLAYVAGDEAGLQVINYLPPDKARQAPTIAFGPPLSLDQTLEIGATPLLTFVTGDDVQVRDVDLFADGVPIGSAGSFPFQIPVSVTLPKPGRTNVVLRARATDTGGNERWTDELLVTLTPDHTSPAIRLLRPVAGSEMNAGALESVVLASSERLAPESFPAGFGLREAGADGTLGTADDSVLSLAAVTDPVRLTVSLRPEAGFRSGRYRLTAGTALTDAAGNPLTAAQSWDFRILSPTVIATSPANNSIHRPGSPVITARFSSLMDAASLRNGGFLLDFAGPDGLINSADDVPVAVAPLTFSALSNRMDLTSAPPLRSGRYRARLTTNALDVLGNRLAAPPAAWNFTVLSPLVTAVDPPDGHARPQGGFREIRVLFTESMDPDTLAGEIELTLTNGTPASGGVATFDVATRTASLTFDSPLPGGEYRLRVGTNVTDLHGNPLGAPFLSRFGVHGPVTWAVDAGGRWDGAGNWSPARPVPGDDVVLDRPAGLFSITNSSGNVLVNSLRSAENLLLTGGSFGLQSNSLVTGPLRLQNLVLSNRAELRLTGATTLGPRVRVRGDGTMVFAGPTSLQGGALSDQVDLGEQHLVIETGPFTWTAGNVSPDSGTGGRPTVTIGPKGILEAVGGASARDWQSRTGGSIWNRGVFRQSGGTNRLRWLYLNITNDGVWEITAGNAELRGGLTQSGRLNLAADTTLRIGDEVVPVNLLPGGVIEGPGSLTFRRTPAVFAGRYAVTGSSWFESMELAFTGELAPGTGSLTFFDSDAIFDNGPLTLNNPLILRQGSLEFRHATTLGDFRWEAGRVRAEGDLTVNGRLLVGLDSGSGIARLAGNGRLRVTDGLRLPTHFTLETNAVLEHAGTTVWQPRLIASLTTLQVDEGGVFRNLVNGRFELATNGSISGMGLFENQGMLVKPANGLTNTFGVTLENTGTLEVAGGMLRLTRAGTLGGTVTVAADAALEIIANQELSGRFTGAGTLSLRGGSNVLTGTLAGPRLVISGPTTAWLPAGITVTNLVLNSGTVRMAGDLRLTGTNSILAGSNARVEGPGILRNEGQVAESVTWFACDIENAGDWTYISSVRPRYGGIFRNLPGATYTVTNLSGSLSQGPAPGTFDNAGLLRQAGEGRARLPFALTNRGVIEIEDTLVPSAGFIQTAEGLTRLNTGRLSPFGQVTLGGEIHGPGTVGRLDGSGLTTLTSGARLRPGGPTGTGVLTFDAMATHLSEGSVVLRIGGLTPGTQHDQIRGVGSLWLGGPLRLEFLSGFTPAVGDRFRIVEAQPRLRTFRSDFEVVGLPIGLSLRLNYLDDGVEAEIISGP